MIEFSVFEKLFLFFFLGLAIFSLIRSYRIIKRTANRGKNNFRKISIKQVVNTLIKKVILLSTTWKTRFWTNIAHLVIVWGFLLFLFVNVYDIMTKFFPNLSFPERFSQIFFPAADILGGLIILGVFYFAIRRIFFRKDLEIRSNVKLLPNVRQSINRDSAIVLMLIFIHVFSRILAESLKAVYIPSTYYLPITNYLSTLFFPSPFIIFFWKVFSWSSLISLLVFIPYFPFSKHFHLVIAPIKYSLRQDEDSLSPIQPINFEDENLQSFGANKLEEMESTAILDAYACIMCCRCQNVCPPYISGSELSPAAYEINKRYYLNQNFGLFSQDSFVSTSLTDFAITEKAVWDCTACGACVNICPVGIDPLSDIIQIRRELVLMENKYPKSFQLLFRNLERYANPWGIDNTHRLDWTNNAVITTIDRNPNPDILWWVGCAGAFDSLSQKSSLALLSIIQQAKVNYSVLGKLENCTGDAARRAGKEDLYFQLAEQNIERLNEINPKRIMTGCAHCFHALKNEYRSFGGHYEVIHSSQLLLELINTKEIKLNQDTSQESISFHDPCYLSRFNDSAEFPHKVLENCNKKVFPLHYERNSTWCCGAGGTQIWKETELSGLPINQVRFDQLMSFPSDSLVTACPFCKTMMEEANQKIDKHIKIEDISEHVLRKIKMGYE